MMLAVIAKKRNSIGRRYKLRASFAARVRVVAAHWIAFSIAPNPFAVLVALIARDVHDDSTGRTSPYGLEHIHSAHHVHFVCFNRLDKGVANEGLSCQMEHDIWTESFNKL